MPDHFFISYSSIDGLEFSLKLADKLAAGPPSFSIWLDKRMLRPGDDWDSQINQSIKNSKALIFLMTEDSVQDHSGCKNEWVQALRFKKPVIPIKMSKCTELPFRLSSRQYIDFVDSFDAGIARLRDHLTWMDTPDGQLQYLKYRMADAQRDLNRAEQDECALIREEITDLRIQITQLQKMILNPQAVKAQIKDNIEQGLKLERRPEKQIRSLKSGKFINPPPLIAPTWFQDRHIETQIICEFLKDDALRLMTVVGRSGIGKTAMVCRLLRSLERGKLPNENGFFAVDGIIYLSDARSFHRIKMHDLYASIIQFIPEKSRKHLNALYNNPQTRVREMVQVLLEALPKGKTVIVLLDNFEDEVEIETGKIKDIKLFEALHALLELPPHGLKVIITTRLAPLDLAFVQPSLQQRINLDDGLKSPDAENVLRTMDVDGKVGLMNAPEDLLRQAQERTRGFPRALEHLFGILSADRDTSLQEIIENTEQLLPDQVIEVLVGEAFNRLDQSAQKIMQALSIYRYPVPSAAIDYLLQPFVLGVNSGPVLSRLVNMQFVRRDSGRYYLHQIDRDYAMSRIPVGLPADREAKILPFSRYALMHMAAEWFKLARKPREAWKSLDDLSAQLFEFELRCACKDYDTAAAVLLEIDYDCLILWGKYPLVASLNEHLKGKIKDPHLKQTCVGNLGTAYWRMGQYHQAISCFKQALSLARKLDDAQNEGIWLGNLGNCYSGLGKTNEAINYLTQALAISRKIGDWETVANWLGNLGNRYADLGQTNNAIECYEQALNIDRDIENREGEAVHFVCLGLSYSDLDKTTEALECYDYALSTSEKISYRYVESSSLHSIGSMYIDQGMLVKAVSKFKKAIEIADEICNTQYQNEARFGLSCSYLYQGKLTAALEMAEAAQKYVYPLENHRVSSLIGVVSFLKADHFKSLTAFSTALHQVDELLIQSPNFYKALDTKGLSLCGLSLCGNKYNISAAKKAYKAARTINSDPGAVRRVLQLFDALATKDIDGILAGVRPYAAGEKK